MFIQKLYIKETQKVGGSFTVEFSKEVYVHSRIPGEFIDKVLKDLGIEHADLR